ncbi:MAG: hypothetical protein GXX85_09195 [Ignavibacteria bacterium]|nr:hypothetical protein [Ignavibacteria bacterium]
MFSKKEDFLMALKNEHMATIKVFEMIDESKKAVKLNDNLRTLERMAWHITQSVTEMPHKVGLVDEDYLDNKPIPATIKELISEYKKYGKMIAESVKSKWTDDDLQKGTNLYGEMWKNGQTLYAIIVHEIHHRGEMIALMRALDMKVPGIYGPAKEEWSNFGMPAME